MANIIKRAKSKFHFATQGGSGTVLGASSDIKSPQTQLPSPVTTQPAPAARPQSSSSKSAGNAALSRYENKTTEQKPRPVTTSSGVVARQETGMLMEARREVEREKQPQDNTDKVAVKIAKKLTLDQSHEPVRSAVGAARVIVDCPLTGKTVEYGQRLSHLQNALQDMYLQEPLYASCLMIHTLGTNSPLTTHLVGTSVGLIEKDKLTACIETINKCLKNILEHPDEEKYRSIRCGSKVLKDKVLPVTGAELFLSAVGFVQELKDYQGNDELFYVLSKPKDVDADSQDEQTNVVVVEEVDKQMEHMTTALDLLNNVTPVKLELNRDTHVYQATTSVNRFPELPSSFFILKPEEVMKENQLRREQVEINEMLLTRAQRDRLEQQSVRQYQFCVVRVRLPDGLVLQATFRAKEKLSDLFYFLSQSLRNEAMLFSLFHQGGKKLENMNLTLQEAELVPAALVNLRIDLGSQTDAILKPTLMRNIQRMS